MLSYDFKMFNFSSTKGKAQAKFFAKSKAISP